MQVEPALHEPPRISLEVVPFIVIGETRGRDPRPRRQRPQRFPVRLTERAVYRLETRSTDIRSKIVFQPSDTSCPSFHEEALKSP